MAALTFPPSPTNLHHRRRAAKPPPVFLRDFAYADNAPVLLPEPMRMARSSIETTSASTFAELLSGPIVDIYVGPSSKHWSLHRNLLCHHSSYFETEFQGHEVPKQQKQDSNVHRLKLPDDDPRGFELLVKWLYQGHLDDASHMSDEGRYDYAVACHKLYQLCDKFDMILLKNLAMDGYRQNLHAAQLVPDADEINEIYRSSPSGSPFRRLMAKIAARQIMDPGVDKDAETYRACFEGNPDFAVEMVNAIRYLSGGILFEDPTEGENCGEWHDHRDGSECYLKGKRKLQQRVVNGVGAKGPHHPQHPPSKSALKSGVQHPPFAELSSEKATPRKLEIRPESPEKVRSTPAKLASKSNTAANGVPSTPTKSTDTAKQEDGVSNRAKNHPIVNGTTAKTYATLNEPKKHLRRQPNGVPNGSVDEPQVKANGASTELKKTSRQPANEVPNGSIDEPQTTVKGVSNESKKPARQQSNGLSNGFVHEPPAHAKANGVHFTPRSSPKKPINNEANGASNQASSVTSGPRKLNHVNGIVKQFDEGNTANGEVEAKSIDESSDRVEKKQQQPPSPPKLKRKAPG